jgi:phosphoribosylformylglycinamidine synthase
VDNLNDLNLPPLTPSRVQSGFDNLLTHDLAQLEELRRTNQVQELIEPIRTRLYTYTPTEAATVRVGIVLFPGTLDDRDAARAVRLAGGKPVPLWHGDENLHAVDAIIIPGGFSYGDYLRCGAISRFAKVMAKVQDAAKGGMPVLGICNGFQILTESHMLPGALLPNNPKRFICKEQQLVVENNQTDWTNAYRNTDVITIPMKNGEGRYVADKKTLNYLEAEGLVVFRYVDGDNPNGSINNIAGICNSQGNVVGLMPHPEHAVEPGFGTDTGQLGIKRGVDGIKFFQSVIAHIIKRDVERSS